MLKGQLDKKTVSVKGVAEHNFAGVVGSPKSIKGQPKVSSNKPLSISMSMKRTKLKGQLS